MTNDAARIAWHPNAGDWWALYRATPAFWVAAIVVGCFTFQGVLDIATGYAAIGLLLLAIGAIPYGLLIWLRRRQALRRWPSEIVVTPGEAGLQVDAGPAHVVHEWASLSVRQTSSMIVIVDGSRRPVVTITVRAFATQEQRRGFLDLVRNLVGSKRGS